MLGVTGICRRDVTGGVGWASAPGGASRRARCRAPGHGVFPAGPSRCVTRAVPRCPALRERACSPETRRRPVPSRPPSSRCAWRRSSRSGTRSRCRPRSRSRPASRPARAAAGAVATGSGLRRSVPIAPKAVPGPGAVCALVTAACRPAVRATGAVTAQSASPLPGAGKTSPNGRTPGGAMRRRPRQNRRAPCRDRPRHRGPVRLGPSA